MRRLAYLNVALHIVGLILGATVMRPGSIVEPLDSKMVYLSLSSNTVLWQVGWGVWMLSALAFVAFMSRLVERVPTARLALTFGAMGGAIDLFCDSLQMLLLPQFAESVGLFVSFERTANLGGLVVANGLYSIAVLVATLQLEGRILKALGITTFVAGMLLVAAGILDSPWLEVLSAPVTILAYCGWVIVVAGSQDK